MESKSRITANKRIEKIRNSNLGAEEKRDSIRALAPFSTRAGARKAAEEQVKRAAKLEEAPLQTVNELQKANLLSADSNTLLGNILQAVNPNTKLGEIPIAGQRPTSNQPNYAIMEERARLNLVQKQQEEKKKADAEKKRILDLPKTEEVKKAEEKAERDKAAFEANAFSAATQVKAAGLIDVMLELMLAAAYREKNLLTNPENPRLQPAALANGGLLKR